MGYTRNCESFHLALLSHRHHRFENGPGRFQMGLSMAARRRQYGLSGGVGVDDLFLHCVEGDQGNAVGDVASSQQDDRLSLIHI